MILEGIVTTMGANGALNIAPMGPLVDAEITRLTLRPFRSAQTYRNLKAHGEGVFHVTDDVLLLAQAAVSIIDPLPALRPATKIRGHILTDACRFYEFRVQRLDDSQERTQIEVEIVAAGRQRDFFGFNRAKHAVVEAAILATRLHFLPRADVQAEMQRLLAPVEKTGGAQELKAFRFLQDYIDRYSRAQVGQ
jgi:uncharacterized protein